MTAALLLAAVLDACPAGAARVVWPSAERAAWSFCLRRPGPEITDVRYNGLPVLRQAHLPVLDAAFAGACGCVRGRANDEAAFEVLGTAGPVAAGPAAWAEAAAPPRSACDTGGQDPGAFRGVALERLADRLVVTSAIGSGELRHAVSWTFRLDGTIAARVGFADAPGACAAQDHYHHAYWRFDLDVGGEAPSGDAEEVRFAGAPGKGTPQVADPATRRGYEVVPGSEALLLPDEPDAPGDIWVLRARDGEADVPVKACVPQLSALANGETLPSGRRVVWYRGSAHHTAAHPEECDVVGPTLQPVGDWSDRRKP